MSQRISGYNRQSLDLYQTPAWVIYVLSYHIPDRIERVWEPAAGDGKMVKALEESGFNVLASDITSGRDFLEQKSIANVDAIITNPPYLHAKEFIRHSIKFMEPFGFVAMLLRTDYDHASSRTHLFGGCKQFAKKVVLTKRIVWFEGSAAPSFNHAWFIWDWKHTGPPEIAYGP